MPDKNSCEYIPLFATTLNSIYFPIYQNQTGIVFIDEEQEFDECYHYALATQKSAEKSNKTFLIH